MKDSQAMVRGGRELAYTDIGHPDGPCIFIFHGAPMSRLHLVALEEQFTARGLRVVSPDRPGYGRSSPQPDRSMADWPADIAALADALHVDRFLVAAHHSRHTAELIRGATFRALPGHGHLTIVPELPAIAAPLVRAAT
jgi:alpha-beta hydrolase superfamily lysophospholipase